LRLRHYSWVYGMQQLQHTAGFSPDLPRRAKPLEPAPEPEPEAVPVARPSLLAQLATFASSIQQASRRRTPAPSAAPAAPLTLVLIVAVAVAPEACMGSFHLPAVDLGHPLPILVRRRHPVGCRPSHPAPISCGGLPPSPALHRPLLGSGPPPGIRLLSCGVSLLRLGL
jgi:hypothetical protein